MPPPCISGANRKGKGTSSGLPCLTVARYCLYLYNQHEIGNTDRVRSLPRPLRCFRLVEVTVGCISDWWSWFRRLALVREAAERWPSSAMRGQSCYWLQTEYSKSTGQRKFFISMPGRYFTVFLQGRRSLPPGQSRQPGWLLGASV